MSPTTETIVPGTRANDQRIQDLRSKGLTPKQIAKQLGLRQAEVSESIRMSAAQEQSIAPHSLSAAVACFVDSGWYDGLGIIPAEPATNGENGEAIASVRALFDSEDQSGNSGRRGLVRVLIARPTRYDKVQWSGFLVDPYCLGVKNAFPASNATIHELREVAQRYFSHGTPVPVSEQLAQWLVHGAVRYARSFGFEPHDDFAAASAVLGPEPAANPLLFGDGGRPHFINGPNDNVAWVVGKLRGRVGQGNFDMTIIG